ncbi:MAG: hypothetical protein ACRD07_06385 [Acidimicrobiales bacterium]
MVDAWAADTAAGHDTLMLAWRRASVADLNRLARVRADQAGWLTGPDFATPDGRGYAVGDPVVTLAPNYDGRLVTSQRGRVVAVNQPAQTLTVATDDGRRVVLRGEALDVDRRRIRTLRINLKCEWPVGLSRRQFGGARLLIGSGITLSGRSLARSRQPSC